MDSSQFEKDRKVDPTQLDMECVRQTDLFFKYAEAGVDAQIAEERAKRKLETVQARLEMACRRDPESFKLQKPTESAVAAAVRLHPDFEAAQEEYLKAKKEARLIQVAVDTMDQKKRMLENLITLHGQQYFAGPSVPRDLMGAWKEAQNTAEATVNEKQKLRTRRRGEMRHE